MRQRYRFDRLSKEAQKVACQWYLDWGPHWGTHIKTLEDAWYVLFDGDDGNEYEFDVTGRRLYPDGRMEG